MSGDRRDRVSFVQTVPFAYTGDIGTRPIEDYFAPPSNLAAELGMASTVISLQEMRYRMDGSSNNLREEVTVLHKGRLGTLIHILKHRSVLYANSRTPVSFLAGLLARRSVFISHWGELPDGAIGRTVFRLAAKVFTFHRANTPHEKQVLISAGVPAARIRLVPLAVDVEYFGTRAAKKGTRAKYGIPRGKKIVSCIAHMRPFKRIRDAMEAVAAVKDAVLVVIGKDLLPQSGGTSARDMIEELGLRDKVVLVGNRGPEEVRELLSISDVYVQPSEKEGQCLTVYEAAAAGLPLCLSRIGSFTSVFTGVARFHDTGDAAGLAKNIRACMKRKENTKERERRRRILDTVREENVNAGLKRLLLETVR